MPGVLNEIQNLRDPSMLASLQSPQLELIFRCYNAYSPEDLIRESKSLLNNPSFSKYHKRIKLLKLYGQLKSGIAAIDIAEFLSDIQSFGLKLNDAQIQSEIYSMINFSFCKEESIENIPLWVPLCNIISKNSGSVLVNLHSNRIIYSSIYSAKTLAELQRILDVILNEKLGNIGILTAFIYKANETIRSLGKNIESYTKDISMLKSTVRSFGLASNVIDKFLDDLKSNDTPFNDSRPIFLDSQTLLYENLSFEKMRELSSEFDHCKKIGLKGFLEIYAIEIIENNEIYSLKLTTEKYAHGLCEELERRKQRLIFFYNNEWEELKRNIIMLQEELTANKICENIKLQHLVVLENSQLKLCRVNLKVSGQEPQTNFKDHIQSLSS